LRTAFDIALYGMDSVLVLFACPDTTQVGMGEVEEQMDRWMDNFVAAASAAIERKMMPRMS